MEEKDEKSEMIDLFAGIALPGIIGRASIYEPPQALAEKAYDIAEAMMEEREKRILKMIENESNN